MTTETINLTFGTVGELRQILNRQDIDDRANVSLLVTAFLGDDAPHTDHGYDTITTRANRVVLIERPGKTQHVRIS